MYKRIKISFINAGSITINEGDWTDYDLVDGFIVIKKRRGAGRHVQCKGSLLRCTGEMTPT